ncbi:hypothetical protein C5688_20605 [Methylocystis sp. MitZ-2018]|nr:hypothetical protein C5688_20605 [Methylocystis sp. MitZ-2018]
MGERAAEAVEADGRRNGGGEAIGGRGERLGYARRDDGEARVLRVGDADEASHNAPHRAEQADEGRDGRDDREIGQARFYVANPDFNNIQPQTTTNFQIGAVYKNEKLTADIALYQITANNFPITITNPDKTVNYQNGGTARYRGVEMELTYQLMGGLALTANGSISDARFLEGQYTGLYVGAAPRYTAMGGIVYDDGHFFGSLLHKQVGDQWGSAGQRSFASIYAAGLTNPTLNYIPSYASTDAVIGARGQWLKEWGYDNKIEVKFGVNNIADNRSVTGISGDPTGLLSVNNTKLTYSFMAGRLFYGGLKVDF